ncbi:TetR/AcrR family transcriptional regulator [Kribbella sp. NPDC023855]|uniref:TetR/AcrR family transcriptional regulator n=1 Tax=Kribbella sp. NPDC023855 TaxID=3154698 RepID=UPI0033FA770D
MSPRATPMPPDERRAALVQATLPLLEKYGVDVSTRQIAEAAGVAEGTIFRAFGSKEALIKATFKTAFDVEPLIEALGKIDRELPLRERLIVAVDISQARLSKVFKLFFALRMNRRPDFEGTPEEQARAKADNARADEVFTDLLRPDADQLRLTPEEVCHRMRLIIFSASHPMISAGRMLTAEEIVDFALDGVRIHDSGDR